MATLTTFTAGTIIRSADVNANFAAINTEVAHASRTGYSTFTPIGNILTGEDTLQSWTMPANTLTAVGDGLQLKAHFSFAANTNNKGISFYIGASAAGFFVNSTVAPNLKDLFVDWTIYVRNLTALNNLTVLGPVILCNYSTGLSPAFETAMSAATTGLSAGSLTSALLVKFTGSATATNDIIQNSMLISIFKAP